MARKSKSMWVVRDMDEEYKEYLDTETKARHFYNEQVMAYPSGQWRLIKLTETPAGSGEFEEDEYLEAHEPEGSAV